MKAIVTCEKNGIRFYLTDENYASDIRGRAKEFRDLTDAALAARKELDSLVNGHPVWESFKWEPAYMMDNGNIAFPDCEYKEIDT